MEKITVKLENKVPDIRAVLENKTPEMSWTMEGVAGGKLETRQVTPTEEEQVITASPGFTGMSRVVVHSIPSNYGRITYDGSKIVVS